MAKTNSQTEPESAWALIGDLEKQLEQRRRDADVETKKLPSVADAEKNLSADEEREHIGAARPAVLDEIEGKRKKLSRDRTTIEARRRKIAAEISSLEGELTGARNAESERQRRADFEGCRDEFLKSVDDALSAWESACQAIDRFDAVVTQLENEYPDFDGFAVAREGRARLEPMKMAPMICRAVRLERQAAEDAQRKAADRAANPEPPPDPATRNAGGHLLARETSGDQILPPGE